MTEVNYRMSGNSNLYGTDECAELFQHGINNIHVGLAEIERGCGRIVGEKLIFGKPQVEKGIAWAELGKCQIEKAIMLGCVPDEERVSRFYKGLADIQTGADGLRIGLEAIPEFWSDNPNHWLGCMMEILSGMVKVGIGHNIVLDAWGSG